MAPDGQCDYIQETIQQLKDLQAEAESLSSLPTKRRAPTSHDSLDTSSFKVFKFDEFEIPVGSFQDHSSTPDKPNICPKEQSSQSGTTTRTRRKMRSGNSDARHERPKKMLCEDCDREVASDLFDAGGWPCYRPHEQILCTACTGKRLTKAVETKDQDLASCPYCAIPWTDEFVKGYLSPGYFEAWLEVVQAHRYYFRCCHPDCDHGQIHQPGVRDPKVTCGACGLASCFAHKMQWHDGLTCAQYSDKLFQFIDTDEKDEAVMPLKLFKAPEDDYSEKKTPPTMLGRVAADLINGYDLEMYSAHDKADMVYLQVFAALKTQLLHYFGDDQPPAQADGDQISSESDDTPGQPGSSSIDADPMSSTTFSDPPSAKTVNPYAGFPNCLHERLAPSVLNAVALNLEQRTNEKRKKSRKKILYSLNNKEFSAAFDDLLSVVDHTLFFYMKPAESGPPTNTSKASPTTSKTKESETKEI